MQRDFSSFCTWARPETPQPKIIYFGFFGVLPEISADRCPEPPQKPYSGGFWGLLGKNTLFLTHFWVFLGGFRLFLATVACMG